VRRVDNTEQQADSTPPQGRLILSFFIKSVKPGTYGGVFPDINSTIRWPEGGTPLCAT